MGGRDCFEGRGRLATKIDITFFVAIEVLNIFHLTIFSEKTIFSKITVKNYFLVAGGGMFSFEGPGCRTIKINTTFFLEKMWYRIHF